MAGCCAQAEQTLVQPEGFRQGGAHRLEEWQLSPWGLPLQQVNSKKEGGGGRGTQASTTPRALEEGVLNSIWNIKIMIPPSSKEILEAGDLQ